MRLLAIITFSSLSSCLAFRTDFGLTAKTYDNFNKDDAEKYNYIFNANNITYRDKDNKEVILTQEEKDKIVFNVNQCLAEAGYGYNSVKTKTINLNLDFTEAETKDSEILYDNEMIERYKWYNYDFEPYIGTKNKTWLILRGDGDFYSPSKLVEIFWNYNGHDKVYFVGLPHYSKFGGITFIKDLIIDVNCQKRSGLFCRWGKSDLSHFYAKLSGKEDNMTKFDVNLHYKINLLKSEKDINKARQHIIDKMSKYICLFISDNVDDLQVISKQTKDGRILFSHTYSDEVYAYYQDIKNKMNNSYNNFYTIKNKLTDNYFNSVYSNYPDLGWHSCRRCNRSNIIYNNYLYGNKIDELFLYSISGSSKSSTTYVYYLIFYENKYKLDQLEIKNNYIQINKSN